MEANCPGRRKANEQKDTLRGRKPPWVEPFSLRKSFLSFLGSLGAFLLTRPFREPGFPAIRRGSRVRMEGPAASSHR